MILIIIALAAVPLFAQQHIGTLCANANGQKIPCSTGNANRIRIGSGGALAKDRAQNIGDFVQGGSWHSNSGYSGYQDMGHGDFFREADERYYRQRQRVINEINHHYNAKTDYKNRVIHKKTDSMSRAEIAKEESENDTPEYDFFYL